MSNVHSVYSPWASKENLLSFLHNVCRLTGSKRHNCYRADSDTDVFIPEEKEALFLKKVFACGLWLELYEHDPKLYAPHDPTVITIYRLTIDSVQYDIQVIKRTHLWAKLKVEDLLIEFKEYKNLSKRKRNAVYLRLITHSQLKKIEKLTVDENNHVVAVVPTTTIVY